MPRIDRVLSAWNQELEDYFVLPSVSVIESLSVRRKSTLSPKHDVRWLRLFCFFCSASLCV